MKQVEVHIWEEDNKLAGMFIHPETSERMGLIIALPGCELVFVPIKNPDSLLKKSIRKSMPKGYQVKWVRGKPPYYKKSIQNPCPPKN